MGQSFGRVRKSRSGWLKLRFADSSLAEKGIMLCGCLVLFNGSFWALVEQNFKLFMGIWVQYQ